MKMNSAWLQLAALVAVACLFQYGTEASPVPAPPDAREESQASPPITEDELNLMIERLLMEAYGDEYEPPPPTRIKTKPQSSRAEVDESKVKAAVRIKTVRQPPKNVDPFQIAADAISSSKTFTEEHRRAKDISNVNVPNKIISGAIVPTQTTTFKTPPKFLDTTPSSSLKQLNVETAGKENNKLPNQIVFDIPPHLTTPTNDVTVTTPKSPTPGIISPEELKKAVVLEQVGHPKVLIVDRRTKQKSSNSGVNNRATSLTSGQAVAQLSSPAQISESIPSRIDPAIRQASNTAGRNFDHTRIASPPTNVQSGVLMTQSVSEDNSQLRNIPTQTGKSLNSGFNDDIEITVRVSPKNQKRNNENRNNFNLQSSSSNIVGTSTQFASNSFASQFPGVSPALLQYKSSSIEDDGDTLIASNFGSSPLSHLTQKSVGVPLPQFTQTSFNALQPQFAQNSVGVPLPQLTQTSVDVLQPQHTQNSVGVPLPQHGQTSVDVLQPQHTQNSVGVPLSQHAQTSVDVLQPQNTQASFGVPLPQLAQSFNTNTFPETVIGQQGNSNMYEQNSNILNNMVIGDLIRNMVGKNQMAIIPLGSIEKPSSNPPIIANLDDGSINFLQSHQHATTSTGNVGVPLPLTGPEGSKFGTSQLSSDSNSKKNSESISSLMTEADDLLSELNFSFDNLDDDFGFDDLGDLPDLPAVTESTTTTTASRFSLGSIFQKKKDFFTSMLGGGGLFNFRSLTDLF